MFDLAMIIYFLLVVVGVIAVVQVIRKKAHKGFLVLLIIPVAIPIIALVDSLMNSYEEQMRYIEKADTTLTVEVRNDDNRAYLYNVELDKEVKYKDLWESSRYKVQKDYHVVYFRELEQFYMVIYSKDNDKTYTDRFKLGDHERDQGDLLFIINREDGRMYPVSSNALSGYELDLNSFQVDGSIVYYGVYLKYETGISHYRNLYIPDDITAQDYGSQAWRNSRDPIYIRGDFQGGSNHIHTLGDPSEITAFRLYEGLFFYIDSYDYIRVGNYTISNGYIVADGTEFLTGQEYILKGFYEFANGSIYYVSNDLKLMEYTSYNANIVVEENVSLINWKDYIPSN